MELHEHRLGGGVVAAPHEDAREVVQECGVRRPLGLGDSHGAAEQRLGRLEVVERRAHGGEAHHRVGERGGILAEQRGLPLERIAQVSRRLRELSGLRLEGAEGDEGLGGGPAAIGFVEGDRLPERGDGCGGP